MKNLNSVFLALFMVVFSISAASAKTIESFIKEYKVKSFTSINANTIADIVYTQCENTIVKAQGSQEMIDHLKVTVDKGVLTITNDKEHNNQVAEPLTVYISSPSIESIETHGKGNCSLAGKVKADNLKIHSEGMGHVEALRLETNKICVNYDGFGDLNLAGTTDIVEITSNGVGNIDAQNLVSKTAMVKSTKLGKVECFATDCVGIFNEGIGDITYHGNPKMTNLQNEGMGKIKEGV